jgi:hypothetical protein
MTKPVIRQIDKPLGNGAFYHRYVVEGDIRLEPTFELPTISTIAKHADTGGDGLMAWAGQAALDSGDKWGFKALSERNFAIGNLLHAQIYRYIQTEIENGKGEGDHPDEASPLFGAWYSAMQESGVEWYGAEVKVYHGDDLFAGTADAIGWMDTHKRKRVATLFDWKTTDEYYWKQQEDGSWKKGSRRPNNHHVHAAQAAGYVMAMRDMMAEDPDLPQPEQAFIVYVFKDTKRCRVRAVDLTRAEKVFTAANVIYAEEHQKGGLYGKG